LKKDDYHDEDQFLDPRFGLRFQHRPQRCAVPGLQPDQEHQLDVVGLKTSVGFATANIQPKWATRTKF